MKINMDGVKRWKVYESKEQWISGTCVARFTTLKEAEAFARENIGDQAIIVWD